MAARHRTRLYSFTDPGFSVIECRSGFAWAAWTTCGGITGMASSVHEALVDAREAGKRLMTIADESGNRHD